MWTRSQSMCKGAMEVCHLDYTVAEGVAAFYGPKLDIQTKTALCNEVTMSTIQLDFMCPERFNSLYVGKDGEEHRPVKFHRGMFGTMERFIATSLEIYKGAFPTWLAPTQAVCIPVNKVLHLDYVNRIKRQMQAAGCRVKVEVRKVKMGYKIREAQTKKIPTTVVFGDKELNDAAVSDWRYGEVQLVEEAGNMFMYAMVAVVKNTSRDGKTKPGEANKVLGV